VSHIWPPIEDHGKTAKRAISQAGRPPVIFRASRSTPSTRPRPPPKPDRVLPGAGPITRKDQLRKIVSQVRAPTPKPRPKPKPPPKKVRVDTDRLFGGKKPISVPPDLDAPIIGEKPVSIWSNLGKAVGKGIEQRIVREIGGGGQKGGAQVLIGGARVAAPVIGRALRTAGTFLTGTAIGAFFAPDPNTGACPVGYHLNKQDGVGGPARTYCVRNRRMNVGNARAARRSVRRLKGARKLLQDIEKMMPRRSAPRARAHVAHVPQQHHH